MFPNLAALVTSGKPRADLEAILLTGIPAGLIKGFTNFTGSVLADMLRLNTSITPTSKPSIYGLVGGDPAGFPNGRRVTDDVVAIELRAIAGVTYPLIDKQVQAGRGGGLAHRRADTGRRQRLTARPVPLPGASVQRLQRAVLTATLPRPGHRTGPVGGFALEHLMTESVAGPSAREPWCWSWVPTSAP